LCRLFVLFHIKILQLQLRYLDYHFQRYLNTPSIYFLSKSTISNHEKAPDSASILLVLTIHRLLAIFT